MAVCVNSSSRRLGMRSATTPAQSEKANTGTPAQNDTTPSLNGERVKSYTNQAWATFCIHVPMSDTSWPKKNRR